MANDVSIELLEGESLEDAIKRIAKASAPESTKPKKASKSKTQKPTTVDPTPPVETPIYAALHLYTLPGMTLEKLRYNAGQERKMHGPGVLIFAHFHEAGEGCKDKCFERIDG